MVTRYVVTVLLLSLGAGASAVEPLAWKFAKGKSWQIEAERTITSASTHPGSESKVVSKTNITSKIVVNDVEGDTATVTETISAVLATIEIDNKESVGGKKTDRLEKVEYDSANPGNASTRAAKSLKAKLEPLVGKSETYKVDTRGQRSEFESPSFGERPNTLGGVLLPATADADEATWINPTITVASPTAAKLDITWKRESVDQDVVKLAGTGLVSSNETTPPWKEASYAATASFDASAGTLVSSETTFTVWMQKVVREKNIDAATTIKTTTAWKELLPQ
jgi:hypothetical protein